MMNFKKVEKMKNSDLGHQPSEENSSDLEVKRKKEELVASLF